MKLGVNVTGRSIDTVSAEDQGCPAQGDPGAVGEGDSPDRLAVNEGPVGGAEGHEYDFAVLDPDLGMVPGNARVDETKVTIRTPAENDKRRTDFVSALGTAVRACLRP